MPVRILIDGLGDVAGQAIWRQTRLRGVAQGRSATGQIVIRDLGESPTDFLTGKRVTVDLGTGTDPIWAGYMLRAARRFWFPVDYPDTMQRQWILSVVDINILFRKRVVFKTSSPATVEGPIYTTDTYDDVVIEDLVTDWLDLSFDDIDVTTKVDRVAHVNVGQRFYPINGGMYWGDAMEIISWLPAAVWSINPKRQLVYSDVDGEDAPLILSNEPGSGVATYRECTILDDGANLANDIMGWGFGKGKNYGVFSRQIDTSSRDLHGLWQDGFVDYGVWKQPTINRIVESALSGSPSSKRGRKNDRYEVNLVTYEHGFSIGQKARFINTIFGDDDVIPIREMLLAFESPEIIRYEMKLSHEIDPRWTMFDPLPPIKTRGWTYPYINIDIDIGEIDPEVEGGCNEEICGITDTFSREHPGAQAWGYSDAGIVWDVYNDADGGATYLHEVTGGRGYMSVSDGGGYAYAELTAPGESIFTASFKFQIGQSGTIDPFASGWSFNVNWCQTVSSGGVFYTRGWALIDGFDVGAAGDVYLVLPHRFAYNNAANDNVIFPFEFDVEYESRYEVDATEQRLKIWKTSDPEPGSWTLVNTLTGPALNLTICYLELGSIDVGTGAMEFYIDDLDISDVDRCSGYRYDNFDRTIVGGLGNPVTGPPWTTSISGGAAGADGGVAYANASASLSAWVANSIAAVPSVTMAARIRTTHLGGVNQFSLAFGDLFEYIRVVVNIDNFGGGMYVDDNIDFIADGIIETGFAANAWWLVKWEVGATHRAKLWLEGASEPDWQVEAPIPSGLTRTHIIFSLVGPASSGRMELDYIDFDTFGDADRPCYADCSSAVTISDAFTRTVAAGWGTSTSGHAWHDSPTTGLNTTGGSRGNLVPTGSGSAIQNWIPVATNDNGFSFKIRVNASRAFVDSGVPYVFSGDFFAIFFTSGGVGSYDVIIGSVNVGVDADGGAHSLAHGINEASQFYIAGEWGGPGSDFNVYVWQTGSQPGTPTAVVSAVATFPVDQFRVYALRAGSALTVSVDEIVFQTFCADPVSGAESSGGTPLGGTVVKDFYTDGPTITLGAAFVPGTTEVWIDGLYQTDYTEDPTAGTITLGFSSPEPMSIRVKFTVA